MKNQKCDEVLSEGELSAWQLLKSIVTNFLRNHRSSEYKKVTEILLEVRISVKLHFLQSHFDYFPKNCGDSSEEQCECFYQDIRIMKKCCQLSGMSNFSLTSAGA